MSTRWREIPVPASVTESPAGADTLIVCQWDRNPFKLGIFTLIWLSLLGFALFWIHEVLGKESLVDWIRQHGWMAIIILSSPSVVAAGSGYGLLATFLNHTDIHIGGSDLKTRIRPIPYRGNRNVPKTEIAQLFVREKKSKDSYGNVTKRYEVHWIDPRGKRRPLIGRLRCHEALYLERRLEELLGIDDQFVRDAFRG